VGIEFILRKGVNRLGKQEKGVSILDTPYAKELINKIHNYKKEEGKSVFDLFSSMEDVHIFIKYVEPTYPPEVIDALKFKLGVADQEGDSIIVEGIGEIDKSIAPFIEKLNKKGFSTLASCSGILKEHPKQSDRMSGYLSFLNEGQEYLSFIRDTCEELSIPCEESEAYFKPSLTVRFRGETDEEIEKKWTDFEKFLFKKEGSGNE
jgi:hypothetical protein